MLALLIALSFSKNPVQSPVIEEKFNQIIGEAYIYINPSTKQELKVYYNESDNTATLYPNENNQVIFNSTTSGSGARYTNDEQGLILWNKGDEISLYLNDSLIFNGIIETSN